MSGAVNLASWLFYGAPILLAFIGGHAAFFAKYPAPGWVVWAAAFAGGVAVARLVDVISSNAAEDQ